MINNPARRFSDGLAGSRTELKRHRGMLRWFVLANDTQGLIDREQNFQRSHDDADERIAVWERNTGRSSSLTNDWRGLIGRNIPACQRSDEVGAVTLALLTPGPLTPGPLT